MSANGGIRYRYYISSALLQERPKQPGTVRRIPAREVEAVVAKAVRDHLDISAEIEEAALISTYVVRGLRLARGMAASAPNAWYGVNFPISRSD